MNAKHLTIALIAGWGLIPLVWAEGDEVVAVAKRKQPTAALPGEKMTERQWTVPLAFIKGYGSDEEKPDPILALQNKGAIFPAGATASYSSKNQKLTVKNTADNLEVIDDAVKAFMDYYGPMRPVGRTTEDFKKWAKVEYKRRQAAVKLMEKVNDAKSGQKALDKLVKIYKANKREGSYNFSLLEYLGSLNVIDQKTRAAVGKKFAKQLKEIYEQQRRLDNLQDLSDNVRWPLVYTYAESAHRFAYDDRTHERWRITEEGIVDAKEEEGSSEVSETSSELPDNEDENESQE